MAGRPLGGCLTPEQKLISIGKARESQKRWRLQNPDRQQTYIKNYRNKSGKESNQFKVMQCFIKRIRTITIDAFKSEKYIMPTMC